MKFHALSLFTLLTLTIGCADDGQTDDDIGSDTGTTDSTGESTGTESESGSTDEATVTTDTAETSESTDATESTEDSTASTDDTTESTDSTSDSTESTDDSTTDTSDTSSDTGEAIMCPGVFPEFDKLCSGNDDCALVIHTTDCCGNSVAWGINEAEVDAFEAAEAICDSQYPPCGCPQGPTVAEDGNQAFDLDSLAVECLMGSCMSYVP